MAIKEDILAYLHEEKDIILAEQEAAKQWTVEEKIEKGILIHQAKLIEIEHRETAGYKLLTFEVEENNSKFRSGDAIHIVSDDMIIDAIMVENGLHEISLQISDSIEIAVDKTYDLIAVGFCLLDNIIDLL